MKKKALPTDKEIFAERNIKELTYHRKPTALEIKFGEGATHYRDFPVEECLKKDGSMKERLKAKNDGLIYTR